MPKANGTEKPTKRRAFRGLALVFVLTFANLAGIGLTLAALGGLEPWTAWQFAGLFGVIEAAAGASNIYAPNIWRLPVAELNTDKRTRVRLAASALLLPHWGGGARAAAGVVMILAAGIHEGWAVESLLLLPFLGLLVVLFLAVSAAIARLGVAYPETDTVQFTINWRLRERRLEPLSLSASLQQFVLGVLTLPAVKIFSPSILYGPEFRPSTEALAAVAGATVLSVVLALLLWAGRIQWRAPREQQREAELNA
jgi:hypothetical protein